MEEGRLPNSAAFEPGDLELAIWAEMDRSHLINGRLSIAEREFLFRGSAFKDITLTTILFHRVMEIDFESPAFTDAPINVRKQLIGDPKGLEQSTLLIWFARLLAIGFKLEHLRTMEKAQHVACFLVQVTTPSLSRDWSLEKTADTLSFLKLALPKNRAVDIEAKIEIWDALRQLGALESESLPFADYLRRLEELSDKLKRASDRLSKSYAKAVGAPASEPTDAEREKLEAFALARVRKLDNEAIRGFLELKGNPGDATKSARARLNEVEKMLDRVATQLEFMDERWAPLALQLERAPH